MTKSLTIGEFKARLPEALALVAKGGSVTVTYGRGKRPVAVLTPPPAPRKRRLGLLAGKARVRIARDWKISDQELLDS